MEEHKATVAALASQVAQFSAAGTPFRIYHGSTLSTRQSSRQRNQIINVSSLNHVLQFNKSAKTVLVEPNVPMDRLVEATLAHGLLPKVVMGESLIYSIRQILIQTRRTAQHNRRRRVSLEQFH
jgi:delta24-sterol reductase